MASNTKQCSINSPKKNTHMVYIYPLWKISFFKTCKYYMVFFYLCIYSNKYYLFKSNWSGKIPDIGELPLPGLLPKKKDTQVRLLMCWIQITFFLLTLLFPANRKANRSDGSYSSGMVKSFEIFISKTIARQCDKWTAACHKMYKLTFVQKYYRCYKTHKLLNTEIFTPLYLEKLIKNHKALC